MKKIGLLSLAIVLALGALGAAYAPWTDQVEITQVVHTGSLEVGVHGYAYLYGDWKDIADAHVSYGDIKFYKGDTGYYDSVTVTVENLYPCVEVWEEFDIVVGGTVPVHLYLDIDVDDPDGLYDHLTLYWYAEVWHNGEWSEVGFGVGKATVEGSWEDGELGAIVEAVQELQLHECENLVIILDKHLAQSGPQGASASFTIYVTAYQYNWAP